MILFSQDYCNVALVLEIDAGCIISWNTLLLFYWNTGILKYSMIIYMVLIRASQTFWSYLPHSGLQSEWSGALLVAVSEG